jgi:hypothetical protein
MNIDSLPKVRFNEMNLQDETVARKLIVGLLDRGIVSVEAVLDIYGEDFLIETERIQREEKVFKQLGIEIKSPFDKPPVAGAPGQGRPPASKDSSTRQTRTPKVRTSAEDLTMFAMDTIDAIDEHIIPIYMEYLDVDNARKLTNEQKEEINSIRQIVLACIQYGEDISAENLLSVAENPIKLNKSILSSMSIGLKSFASTKGTNPTSIQRKRIEALAWASHCHTDLNKL